MCVCSTHAIMTHTHSLHCLRIDDSFASVTTPVALSAAERNERGYVMDSTTCCVFLLLTCVCDFEERNPEPKLAARLHAKTAAGDDEEHRTAGGESNYGASERMSK